MSRPLAMKSALVVGMLAIVIGLLVFFARSRTSPPGSATAQVLDDLSASVESLLRSQPEVVRVEVAVGPVSPSLRIIHLRSWHFVPQTAFARDVRAVSKGPLTDDQVGALYLEHLREVERVEEEQLALLRRLAQQHGLRRVFLEGLTSDGVAGYRAKAEALAIAEREEASKLRQQMVEARQFIKEMEEAGKRGTENYQKAAKIERSLAELLETHRRSLLELGAPAPLLAAGLIEEVLPLDDKDALEAANPLRADGAVRLDDGKLRKRQGAIVKGLLGRGPCVLIVLGGAHDLSASVRAQASEAEYLRVTTKGYQAISGEGR
jgi:hypothetical protein